MNVGELKERLDDYGDHLEVVIVVEADGRSRTHKDFTVDTGAPQGEPRVELLIELG